MKTTSAQIADEIKQRFGNLPSFFMLAMDTPIVAADLWRHARVAYLDNPIPFAFKERLFLSLSRFCKVSYCVGRHSAVLISPSSHPATADERALTAAEVLEILRSPIPDHESVPAHLAILSRSEPLTDWPDMSSQRGCAIFHCSLAIFLGGPDVEGSHAALRRVLSPSRYHCLLMLLSFARRAHEWTEAHSDIELEPDIQRLIDEHQELADWIAEHPSVAGLARVQMNLEDPKSGDSGYEESREAIPRRFLLELHSEISQSVSGIAGDGHFHWLQREQALFTGIIRGIPDAIILAGMDRRITYCNPAVARVFGYESEELVGQSTRMLYADEADFTREGALRFHYDASEHPEPMFLRWRHKDGHAFDGEAVGTIIRDSDGEPLSFLALVRDVTQQRRLQAEQQRYNDVLDALSRGLAIDDLLRLIVTQSQDAREGMIGSILLLDESGEHLRTACAPDLPAEYVAAIEGIAIGKDVGSFGAAMATGKRVIVEDITRDHRWNELREPAMRAGLRACWSEPILAADGQVIGATARYFRQPTSPSDDDLQLLEHSALLAGLAIERSRMTRTLAESEERLRLALKASDEAVWDWDVIHNRVWINQAYRDRFGGPLGDDDPLAWWQGHVHPNDRQRVLKRHAQLMTGDAVGPELERERWVTEYRLRRLDGSYAIVQDRVLQTLDDEGKQVRMLGTLVDLTEQRALQREVLEIAAAEAWRIGNDLHDGVGQELTGMGMLADSMKTSLARDGDAGAKAAHVKIADKLADSVSRTLHQVRALARGMNPVNVDREGLMSAISEMCGRIRELHGVDCRFECAQPIGFRDNQTATQLYRIAQEATTNAVKHGKATRITIRLAAGNPRVELTIRDDGVGLPSGDELKRGVGMQTMGYRANQIGGDLSFNARPGGGTEVACCFPQDAIT